MRRLSSSFTVFYKRVFPFVWLLIPILSGCASWTASLHSQTAIGWLSLLPSLVIFLAGVVIYRRLIFDLVDEVWFDGDQLMAKKGGQQARLALADVINVNIAIMIHPRRVTLMRRTDSRFGRRITFMPASAGSLGAAFKSDPIATDLIRRSDALREVCE